MAAALRRYLQACRQKRSVHDRFFDENDVMATSSRMLVLLSLLQARRDWPGHLLARRLEISARTVRRDVERLRELGYRIEAVKGPDGGYRLAAGSELPPLLFDDDQAVALAVALQTAQRGGAVLGEAADRALATVRQLMPSRLRHRIDAIEILVIPHSAAPDSRPVDAGVVAALSTAVREHLVVRFDYASTAVASAEPAPPRRVQPHGVATRSGRWYLVGWDLDRDDWRTFRVDRISLRAATGPRFDPRAVPGGDVADFMAGRFKGTAGTNVWPCQGVVTLALPAAEVAPYVGDGVVEMLGHDRCRLTVGAWSWVGVAASIGRFDADISEVGPPELLAAFGSLAGRYAAAAQSRIPIG